jgi:hypothetical protein
VSCVRVSSVYTLQMHVSVPHFVTSSRSLNKIDRRPSQLQNSLFNISIGPSEYLPGFAAEHRELHNRREALRSALQKDDQT